jgi:hypothetical protein
MARLLSHRFGTKSRKPAARSFRPVLEHLEDRTVPTVLFNPQFGADTIVLRDSNANEKPGDIVTSAMTSNPNALTNTPHVYLIFAGSTWTNTLAQQYAQDVDTIVNKSSYLSGLTQYGATGHATFNPATDWYVDNTPAITRDLEISRTLNTAKTSWVKPTGLSNSPTSDLGSASYQQSPIYVVVYDSGGGGDNGGGVYSWFNQSAYAMNTIRVYVDRQSGKTESVIKDAFDIFFSHELVERIADGTGIGFGMNAPTTPISTENNNGQIADNEPDGQHYTYRLNGPSGPLVQAYWSIVDQAFIVPDGSPQATVLDPMWNGYSFQNYAVSLQQGHLYRVSTGGDTGSSQDPTSTPQLIDSTDPSVQSYVLDGRGDVFYLTSSGTVMEYSGSGNPFPVTGSNTTATALVRFNGSTYMLGHNTGQPDHVWFYNGSPMSWAPDSNTPTNLKALVANAKSLYVLGNNGGVDQVFEAEGFGNPWTAVTGTNTTVSQIATALGPWNDSTNLFMRAHNVGPDQVYQYSGSGMNWTNVSNPVNNHPTYPVSQIAPAYGGVYVLSMDQADGSGTVWQYSGLDQSWQTLTGGTRVAQIAASGGTLYMVGNNGGANQAWRYTGSAYNWSQMTAYPSTVFQIAVQGSNLYMVADNGLGMVVWQYSGSGKNWNQLNDTRWTVSSVQLGADGTLWMNAAYQGGTFEVWKYGGSYDQWTLWVNNAVYKPVAL